MITLHIAGLIAIIIGSFMIGGLAGVFSMSLMVAVHNDRDDYYRISEPEGEDNDK